MKMKQDVNHRFTSDLLTISKLNILRVACGVK